MVKTYKRKSQEEKEKEVDELIEKANIGIENSFTTPESLKEFLNYMSKFYNYSLRNASLIQEQFRGALAVGSYAFWKEKGFTVNKGEKGIKILVPNRLSDYFINEKGEEVKLKDATKEEKRLIEQGEIEVRKGKLIFNQGYVFEVTQTNAKAEDLPKIFPNRWLDGEVKNYDLMYKAIENIARKIGVKIIEPKDELGAVKGVSYPGTKEVALNPRNTQLQNVKTLIHELTHAKLHTMETRDNYTTNAKEFQAEMAAYVICSYFGLDTSEYSFRYISSWTKDAELKDKEKLINEVRETSKEYIEVIEETLINDKEISLSLESENSVGKREEREYDKKLYEIKEQEVMNNNNIKEMLKNLKEKVMTKVNSLLGKEIEEIDIEKEEREFEELFLEAEESMEMEDIDKSIIFRIDGIVLEASTENGIEEEKLLKLRDDLMELYEREIPEEYKTFMKKRGLELDGFVESFEERLKSVDFEVAWFYDISFKDYLEETLRDYGSVEYEEFEEETYMDRLERKQIGEEEYIKIYGKNNVIDTYMHYYERAYISYENLDKEKLYNIEMDMQIKDIEIKEGEEFKIVGYDQGEIIIEFPNKEVKESVTFNSLQGLSDLLKKDIDNIIEVERYFNENNIEEDLRKELHQNKELIDLLDEKRKIDVTIRNLKEDIEYYSEDNEYSIDDLKSELNKYENLSLDNSKELNRVVDYKIEEEKDIEVINNEVEVKQELENDAWKLTDKEIEEAERLVELNQVKEKIDYLMEENYGDFVMAMISIETGINDLDLLENLYEKYMKNDFKLINDNFEELKNELEKECEMSENSIYLSKEEYKEIGIDVDKVNMNEMAITDNEKFLEIIREKSISKLVEDREKMTIVNDKINGLEDKTSKEGTIYYGMLVALGERLNNKIDIVNKIGLNEELRKNKIEKIEDKHIEEFKLKARELEVGEVRILNSENNSFKENQIIDFPKANDLFKYEEMRIENIKKEYERENEYYPNEKVTGQVKIAEEKVIEFRYDIGQGEFYNLADLLERQLSNTNSQYDIKDFLIEQGVRENKKEEKSIGFTNDNFIYNKEREAER